MSVKKCTLYWPVHGRDEIEIIDHNLLICLGAYFSTADDIETNTVICSSSHELDEDPQTYM